MSILKAHESNILVALQGLSEFMVGVTFQPAFTVLIFNFLFDMTYGIACALQVFTITMGNFLGFISVIHRP